MVRNLYQNINFPLYANLQLGLTAEARMVPYHSNSLSCLYLQRSKFLDFFHWTPPSTWLIKLTSSIPRIKLILKRGFLLHYYFSFPCNICHTVVIQHIFVDWMWISVLVYLGCCNKNTINRMAHAILTVLGAEESKIEVLVDSVSSKDLFSVS